MDNDWKPQGFGGSADIEEATGARPVLNTANGGNVADLEYLVVK